MAVVASGSEPQIRFEGFARGKGEGAATAAGSTFLSCAGGLGMGSCTGPFCGAVVVVWLAFCGTAAAVGGVVGAASAQDAPTVRAAEAVLQTAIAPETIQEALRAHAESAARARGAPFADGNPDTMLEVGIVRAGTQGQGLDAPVSVAMQARARLLRAMDGTEIHTLDFSWQGPARRLAEWSADGGRPLVEALATGYGQLGVDLYESMLQLYPFPDREFQGAGALAAAFGLAPLEPRVRGSISGEAEIRRRIEWPAVAGLRPMLRWQAFPRERDFAAAPGDMARVRNVTYDLAITRERHLAPEKEVYRRERLPRPEHRLEAPLDPAAYYFWSVRARFELDGRERVTEWSTTHWAAFGRTSAPSRWSYRFRTP